ncbi:unnamed protein product [Alternaria alternata]
MSAKLMKDRKEVDAGTRDGELCLKGPNIFKGYYNNPEATARAFNAEGWYHTGDVGKFDEHRNLFITDRLKELIKAYIVAALGYKGDKKLDGEMHEWFNKRVAPHKKLRGGIRFVEAVPKSNAGKILRRVLVEQAKAEEAEKAVKARL